MNSRQAVCGTVAVILALAWAALLLLLIFVAFSPADWPTIRVALVLAGAMAAACLGAVARTLYVFAMWGVERWQQRRIERALSAHVSSAIRGQRRRNA